MTTVYVILAAVFLLIMAFMWAVSKAGKSGEDQMKIKYQEKEIELREKMADIDASTDDPNPLDKL